MTRKPLSKRIRFEVLKRDSFSCQYCGAKAPDVLLHIDHIVPISKGGDNDILNLVTACSTCNLGKRNKELADHSAVEKARRQLDDLQERKNQVELMMAWKNSLKAIENSEVDQAEAYWEDLTTGFHLPHQYRKLLARLIKKCGFQITIAAMDEVSQKFAYDRGGRITPGSWNFAISKLEQVAHSLHKYRDDPLGMHIAWVCAVLRNRFGATQQEQDLVANNIRVVVSAKRLDISAVRIAATKKDDITQFNDWVIDSAYVSQASA